MSSLLNQVTEPSLSTLFLVLILEDFTAVIGQIIWPALWLTALTACQEVCAPLLWFSQCLH